MALTLEKIKGMDIPIGSPIEVSYKVRVNQLEVPSRRACYYGGVFLKGELNSFLKEDFIAYTHYIVQDEIELDKRINVNFMGLSMIDSIKLLKYEDGK